MRAILMHEHGGPDVLHLEDLSDPRPGFGEALVRVHAVAVNRLDIWVRENAGHDQKTKLPLIPGYDVAGVIVELGSDTSGVAVGDRVYVHPNNACGRCRFCLDGDEALCADFGIMGVDRDGGYAELVAAPVKNLIPLGSATSFEAAAAVGSVYLTAYHMVFTRAKLRAGETVLIMAAGSGVGGAALRLARWAGARVLATAGSAEKRERAKAEGAEHAIDYTVPDWHEEVLRMTDGQGADVIIDHTGSTYFVGSLRSLASRGRLVVCGASSGAAAEVDLIDLFTRQLSIIGSCDGTPRELAEVFRLLDQGLIDPRIDTVLPLAAAAAAQERLARRDHYGRVLLRPIKG